VYSQVFLFVAGLGQFFLSAARGVDPN